MIAFPGPGKKHSEHRSPKRTIRSAWRFHFMAEIMAGCLDCPCAQVVLPPKWGEDEEGEERWNLTTNKQKKRKNSNYQQEGTELDSGPVDDKKQTPLVGCLLASLISLVLMLGQQQKKDKVGWLAGCVRCDAMGCDGMRCDVTPFDLMGGAVKGERWLSHPFTDVFFRRTLDVVGTCR